MTKKEREEREYASLFQDQRYAKKAWRQVIAESLSANGKPLPEIIDPKTEAPTLQSEIDRMAYDNVVARLRAEGKDREPMQAELIVECNVIRARFADQPFNTLLDRTAGKVKEEVAITDNPYDDLTDDELEALLAYRQSRDAAKAADAQTDEASPDGDSK